MEISRRRILSRWLVRLFIGISTIFGFWLFYNMHLYMPWHFRSIKALEMTLLGHLGLWLATLEARGRLRFLVAAVMVPSMAVVFFLWWGMHLFVALGVMAGMIWLLLQVLRGQPFEN